MFVISIKLIDVHNVRNYKLDTALLSSKRILMDVKIYKASSIKTQINLMDVKKKLQSVEYESIIV